MPCDSKMVKIRVLIADDHAVVREGLIHILEGHEDLECVGTSSDGQEVIKQAKKLQPDVVVLDIVMPIVNGIDAAREIKKSRPKTAILIISAFKHAHEVRACIEAGVHGYLMKDTAGAELCNAIRMVHAGKQVFDPSVTNQIVESYDTAKDRIHPYSLRTREIEVLKLAAKGMSNKQIGIELSISHFTVSSHFVNIFKKLGVGSRTEAVTYAIKESLFSFNDLPD